MFIGLCHHVYQIFICSYFFQERTVFDNLTITSAVKHGLFYNATYEASFNIVADVCSKKPTLLCYIGDKVTLRLLKLYF
jgi:hypothetical protein